MKIYVASSWKNKSLCYNITELLRDKGHDVDCFCSAHNDRYVFNYQDMPNIEVHDGISIMNTHEFKAAFAEDKKWIDWADAVVMLLPCGKSAHLEAGYAKGQGKKLYIYGRFPVGEYDVVYGFADGLFRSFTEMAIQIEKDDIELKRKNKQKMSPYICDKCNNICKREITGDCSDPMHIKNPTFVSDCCKATISYSTEE